jgi:hypothetical protein
MVFVGFSINLLDIFIFLINRLWQIFLPLFQKKEELAEADGIRGEAICCGAHKKYHYSVSWPQESTKNTRITGKSNSADRLGLLGCGNDTQAAVSASYSERRDLLVQPRGHYL